MKRGRRGAESEARFGTIPIRAFLPNLVTAMALCSGLSAFWFATDERWAEAVLAILVAGILDGLDGRIARLLHGETRFGAELDSLSDNIAFGVAPALVTFLWSLQHMPKFGWTIALFYALCCALRLARFNARIDDEHQPKKAAGYLTGVPAPAGAVIALMPMIGWLALGDVSMSGPLREALMQWWVTGPWLFVAALLMISSIATFSGTALRIRRRVRFEAIVLVGFVVAALISAPWMTLFVIALGYFITLPFSMRNYAKARKRAQLRQQREV